MPSAGIPSREPLAERLEQVERAGQLGHRGRLAARQHQPVALVELRRPAYAERADAQPVQHLRGARGRRPAARTLRRSPSRHPILETYPRRRETGPARAVAGRPRRSARTGACSPGDARRRRPIHAPTDRRRPGPPPRRPAPHPRRGPRRPPWPPGSTRSASRRSRGRRGDEASTCFAVVRDGRLVADWSWRARTRTTRGRSSRSRSRWPRRWSGSPSARGCWTSTTGRPAGSPSGAAPGPGRDVRHLLTNTSGRFWSADSDYRNLVGTDDRTGYAVGLRSSTGPAPPGRTTTPRSRPSTAC